ncbi:hypothetical protein PRIC2_005217 [Phytophthora ramorum]
MAALQDPPPPSRVQSLQKLCLKAIGRQLKHFCNLRLHPVLVQTLSGPEKQLLYAYDLSRLDVFEAQAFLQTINKWCCKVERNRRRSRHGRLPSNPVDRVVKSFLRYVLLPLTEKRADASLHELSMALGFAAPPELELRPATLPVKPRKKWIMSAGRRKTGEGAEQDAVSLPSSSSEIFSQTEAVYYRLPVASVGCGLIASMLQQSTSLVKLRLTNCQIADAGAILLASGIRLTPALQLLDLSNDDDEPVYREKELMDNKIGSNGVHALAIALEQNRTLKQVDLSRNPVGPRGALALAAMLRKNESLQRLYLDRTHVQDSAEPLIDAFALSNSLQQLSMLWCAFRTGVGAKLASIQASKTASAVHMRVEADS